MIDIALRKSLQSAAGQLDLDIRAIFDKRSFVTLFGTSGSGKTTILRMLAGLITPDSGKLVVAGQTWFDSFKRINIPPQERAIGIVFQDYALFPNLSVRQNVAYGARKDDTAWVDELIDLAGLGALQHRFPETLSGGQKQRVALARALAKKPELLLLDEPLSALDAALRSQLQDDLLRMHERLGLTTLLVSHDLGEVFKLSSRVLRLDAGRITHCGTPSEIFLKQRLSGKLNLRAQVLSIRREEVIHVVSLLIGQDIIDVIASDDEVAELHSGDIISVATKTVSPFLLNISR